MAENNQNPPLIGVIEPPGDPLTMADIRPNWDLIHPIYEFVVCDEKAQFWAATQRPIDTNTSSWAFAIGQEQCLGSFPNIPLPFDYATTVLERPKPEHPVLRVEPNGTPLMMSHVVVNWDLIDKEYNFIVCTESGFFNALKHRPIMDSWWMFDDRDTPFVIDSFSCIGDTTPADWNKTVLERPKAKPQLGHNDNPAIGVMQDFVVAKLQPEITLLNDDLSGNRKTKAVFEMTANKLRLTKRNAKLMLPNNIRAVIPHSDALSDLLTKAGCEGKKITITFVIE